MNFERLHWQRMNAFLIPEYGGDAVSGGGHPADSSVPVTEAIDDAFAQNPGGRGKIPGVDVPGSGTNPVSHDEISRRAHAIWEEEGRPEGKAEEHWMRAVRELSREDS
jgi:hypothetical protein